MKGEDIIVESKAVVLSLEPKFPAVLFLENSNLSGRVGQYALIFIFDNNCYIFIDDSTSLELSAKSYLVKNK